MNTTAIIAEYNPFHNGHLYQLRKIKQDLKSDYIISIISGNFSQRGTPCIVDKFLRTQMALVAGVDLVIELPAIYASSSAEFFARGAISILDKSHIIDTLCFGAELPDVSLLDSISKLLLAEPVYYKDILSKKLRSGMSYAVARSASICEYLNDNSLIDFLKLPNNILGIEYYKALNYYSSPIMPYPIQRAVANYHDQNIYSKFASASAIRNAISIGDDIKNVMPEQCGNLLMQNINNININMLLDFLRFKLLTVPKEKIYSTWDVPSNLINTLYKVINNNSEYTGIVKSLTSKTFSTATVYRSLLRIILGVNEDFNCDYIRVLGVRQGSMPLLNLLCKNSDIPIIVNVNKDVQHLNKECRYSFEKDLLATNLYNLIIGMPNAKNDYATKLIKN
ncbi:MAG: hypothetical protein BEN19_01605 [Epulopiscium sp. Nuni2H_MBin003]|nr:MAG: hypothetical protein BEN19_01605 [Epulopiscium sp. Nuni2H_MBin003]